MPHFVDCNYESVATSGIFFARKIEIPEEAAA